MFFGVPRVFQKFQAAIFDQINRAGGLKKNLIKNALAKGEYCAKHDEFGGDKSTQWGWTFYNSVILSAVRKALGLDRAQLCIVGGAPADPELVTFFHSLNIGLLNVYGASETSAMVSALSVKAWKVFLIIYYRLVQ